MTVHRLTLDTHLGMLTIVGVGVGEFRGYVVDFPEPGDRRGCCTVQFPPKVQSPMYITRKVPR